MMRNQAEMVVAVTIRDGGDRKKKKKRMETQSYRTKVLFGLGNVGTASTMDALALS